MMVPVQDQQSEVQDDGSGSRLITGGTRYGSGSRLTTGGTR